MDNIDLYKITDSKRNWKVYNEFKREILSFENKTYSEVRGMNMVKPNYIIVEDKKSE